MAQPTAAVSIEQGAKVRKTIALVLKRAQTATNRKIAHELQVEESTVSRWRDDHLTRAIEYILATGCKVVPSEKVCYDQQYIDSLEYFAEIGMRHAKAEKREVLEWDE